MKRDSKDILDIFGPSESEMGFGGGIGQVTKRPGIGIPKKPQERPREYKKDKVAEAAREGLKRTLPSTLSEQDFEAAIVPIGWEVAGVWPYRSKDRMAVRRYLRQRGWLEGHIVTARDRVMLIYKTQ